MRIANNGADAVKAGCGCPERPFSCLSSPGEPNGSHMGSFEETVNRIAGPQGPAAIVEVVRDVFRLSVNVFHSIPRPNTAEERHAA